jgi:type IV fimbrial biogenesis protein FimT
VLAARQRGVSLIEVLIGMAIIATIAVMGFPGYRTFVQNGKIRSAAEGIYSGLQLARAEAVSRNVQTQFILTSDDLSTSIDPNGVTPAADNLNWLVRAPDPSAPASFVLVVARPAAEGSGTTVQLSSGGVTTVVFTPYGATTLAGAATFSFSNTAVSPCAASGGNMRCLNIVVSVGGQIRLCDPKVNVDITAGKADVSDTRKC